MSALPPIAPRAAITARELALAYGRAKSRQDIAAALACCTDDFVLEPVPFGIRAAGRAEVEHDLGIFFHQFPDYRFSVTSSAESSDAVVLWGHVTMTWSGRLPPGTWAPLDRVVRLRRRHIELPAVAVLDVRDGLLARERFFFDLPSMCRQMRLPQWLVRALLRRTEERRHRVVHGVHAIRIEHTRIVDAPIDVVYARAFGDVSALVRANPRWPLPRARRIELVDATGTSLVAGSALRPGAIRRIHLSTGHVTDELFEGVDAPHRIRYRVVTGWGQPFDAIVADTRGEHELEAQLDGRTRVTWRGWIVPRDVVVRPLARLLARTILAPMFRRYLAGLDRIVLEGAR
jgi:hypothetical protein